MKENNRKHLIWLNLFNGVYKYDYRRSVKQILFHLGYNLDWWHNKSDYCFGTDNIPHVYETFG